MMCQASGVTLPAPLPVDSHPVQKTMRSLKARTGLANTSGAGQSSRWSAWAVLAASGTARAMAIARASSANVGTRDGFYAMLVTFFVAVTCAPAALPALMAVVADRAASRGLRAPDLRTAYVTLSLTGRLAAFQWPASVPHADVIASVLVLSIVCTAIAFVFFFALIAEIGPVRATVFTYINPAVAAVVGVLVLHENFTFGMAIGFVLVLAGSALATRRPARLESQSSV